MLGNDHDRTARIFTMRKAAPPTSQVGVLFSTMGGPPNPERLKRSADGLKRLADAYDVSTPTLDAIADAIIARTQLTDGKYERRAVMDLVAFIVEDVGTLISLETGGKLPDNVLNRMGDLIASDPPATVPEWDFLQIVLDNVRSVLRPPSTAE